jgi:gamma-glutamylputrescine oxidase
MAGELHVASYYAATANETTNYPALEGEIVTDVCIIGGGFSGLSAALELARRGYRTVLLEANRVVWGASGRNGGQIVGGYSASMTKIRRWVGREDARQLWDVAQEAIVLLRDRIRDFDIDCDLKSGYLFAAVKDRHIDDLRSDHQLYVEEYDYHETMLLGREQIRAEVDTAAYCGGLLDRGGGHLHPLNYGLGLARAATSLGVSIYEGTQARRLVHRPQPIVETDRGSVRAKYLILCGNAYLGALVPDLRRKIMPVATYIAATEPLGDERAMRLIPNDVAVADIKFVLDYFRLSADRRMLFGGKVSYTTLPPPNLKTAMRRTMLAVFPQLANARIDYVWGGNVAITVERTPHIGRLDDNTYFAQGFSGHGVALTGIAGRIIAEAIGGTAEKLDLFARLPHRDFVGGRLLRTPTLALAMLYLRLKDLM